MTHTFKIPVVAVLIVSMALLSVRSSVFAQSPGFTGEDIYRGLIWGDGPAAKLLPEVWQMAPATFSANTKETAIAEKELRENVIAAIIADDPTFMSHFGEEMQSGDHLRVQAALEQAGAKTVQVLHVMGYVDSDGNPDIVITLCAFRVLALVYVVVAIAVLWVQVYFPRRPGMPGGDQSDLYKETLTDLLTLRLAPE